MLSCISCFGDIECSTFHASLSFPLHRISKISLYIEDFTVLYSPTHKPHPHIHSESYSNGEHRCEERMTGLIAPIGSEAMMNPDKRCDDAFSMEISILYTRVIICIC